MGDEDEANKARVCYGDSGGALLQKQTDDKWMIIGVNSAINRDVRSVKTAENCGNYGSMDFWTNVVHYAPWIQEQISVAKTPTKSIDEQINDYNAHYYDDEN